MPIVLDTHAWLWWVTEDRRLSAKARMTIHASQREDDAWLSPISIWEIARKVEKRQLVLDRPLDDWLDAATTMPGLRLAELGRSILVASCALPPSLTGDPADQIIVATARQHAAPVVTKDRKIRRYQHVRSIW